MTRQGQILPGSRWSLQTSQHLLWSRQEPQSPRATLAYSFLAECFSRLLPTPQDVRASGANKSYPFLTLLGLETVDRLDTDDIEHKANFVADMT